MAFTHALFVVAALLAINKVESCQVKGTGCSKTLTCCAGLKCDLTSTGWGFCNPGSGDAPAPAPVPAPKPPPAPAPKQPPAPAPKPPPAPAPAPTSQTYSGDITYYSPSVGLGACGQLHQDSEMVVAVTPTIYGTQANPNNSPACGKCIKVTYQGKSVTVKITDKLPKGVTPYDLDLTFAAMKKIVADPIVTGRVRATWTYVNGPC